MPKKRGNGRRLTKYESQLPDNWREQVRAQKHVTVSADYRKLAAEADALPDLPRAQIPFYADTRTLFLMREIAKREGTPLQAFMREAVTKLIDERLKRGKKTPKKSASKKTSKKEATQSSSRQ